MRKVMCLVEVDGRSWFEAGSRRSRMLLLLMGLLRRIDLGFCIELNEMMLVSDGGGYGLNFGQ